MKKLILILWVVFLAFGSFAQQNCSVADEKPLQLLSAEMKRSFKTLKKLKPPVYYLSYTYKEIFRTSLEIHDGGVVWKDQQTDARLAVLARVGSPKMDNTRKLKKADASWNEEYGLPVAQLPKADHDGLSFTRAVWRATQKAVEKAQQDFSTVQADAQTSSDRRDTSDDFVFPPRSAFCHTESVEQFDLQRIEQLLLKASALTQGKPFVLDSSFLFSMQNGSRYFVDSVGTQLKTPVRFARLAFQLAGQTADGQSVERFKAYDVLTEEELPSEQELLAAVENEILILQQILSAPIQEPIAVPAILKNRAMSVFLHEVLGHRLEGTALKDDMSSETFVQKIGQQIMPSFLTVIDDPSLAYFKGHPLRGFYEYDDEGVKSFPVTLVENGVLKNFLMNSTPLEGMPRSNAHGRGELSRRAVARMGNIRILSSQTVPYEELEKQLLEEVNKQGKPYGLIVEDLSGGFTFSQARMPQAFTLKADLVYRLYPDGHKEPVRGAKVGGSILEAFNAILNAADDEDVFNGVCGAESGYVPQANIAPSMLFSGLNFEKKEKTPEKLPLLPPPSAEVKK